MTKAAILIDGGYFLKRLPAIRKDIDTTNAGEVARSIKQLIRGHLEQLNRYCESPHYINLLYRGFYYDAPPYEGKLHTPILRRSIDFKKSQQAKFRKELFHSLHRLQNLAVRLGKIRKAPVFPWALKPETLKNILRGKIKLNELTDDDFTVALRQKGVDMRIGMDIAAITLKRQANVIVLISGDTDFVPAAKFARREGVRFILDTLRNEVSPDLSKYIDGLQCGFYNSRPRDYDQ